MESRARRHRHELGHDFDLRNIWGDRVACLGDRPDQTFQVVPGASRLALRRKR